MLLESQIYKKTDINPFVIWCIGDKNIDVEIDPSTISVSNTRLVEAMAIAIDFAAEIVGSGSDDFR